MLRYRLPHTQAHVHGVLAIYLHLHLHSPQARRVAQRDTLVTVRHLVPVEAVEAGNGAPPR